MFEFPALNISCRCRKLLASAAVIVWKFEKEKALFLISYHNYMKKEKCHHFELTVRAMSQIP